MANQLQYYGRRHLVKRSTIHNEEPTIPVLIASGGTAVDVNDHTKGGWLDTDIYEGELFINTTDDKMWMRTSNGIITIDAATGYPNLTDLTDTPSSYTGEASKLLAVRADESGVEFIPNTTATALTDLTDTPSSISDGTVLVGSSLGPTYQAKPYIDTMEGLTDVDGYVGNGQKLYRIKASEDGVEAINGANYYLDLVSNQSIGGNKIFTGTLTASDATITNLTIGSDTVDDVITDTDLVGAADSNIPSTLAAKTYIDNKVITAVGGDYVARTGSVTIEGNKTFTDNTQFDADLNVNGDTNIADLHQGIANYHYFGDASTDGSFRIHIDVSGKLLIEKRVSGSWVIGDLITNNSGLWGKSTGSESLIPSGTTNVASGISAIAVGGKFEDNGIIYVFPNTASGDSSWAEGCDNLASGIQSHAEGGSNIASGYASHAEGYHTKASGHYSHAGGIGNSIHNVLADGIGSFNHSYQESTTSKYGTYGNYSAILGGRDNKVTSDNSAIIGGNTLENTVDNTVMVPALVLGSTTQPTSAQAGTIYFNGSHFYGFDGTNWKQLDN